MANTTFEAGPSTVRPTRELHQPSRLSVAHRGASGNLDQPSQSDLTSLKNDLDRRKLLARKAEKWADKLMEETPSLKIFKKGVSYLNTTQYREVLHERHLNGTCSYPPCSAPPKAPYNPHKKIKISWSSRSVDHVEGNAEEGFCSRKCEVRSRWVEDQLSKRALWERGGGVELLEEAEGEAAVNGDATVSTGATSSINTGGIALNGKGTRSNGAISLGKTIISHSPLKPPSPAQRPTDTADLMSNLTIHERPTPLDQPIAPSLDPPPPTKEAVISPSKATSRRDGSSMLATPSKLTSTLLSASRNMGPLPQMGPDPDDDGEEHDWGEEEMGLTWGEEDEEMKRLFAQAQMAREMDA